MLEYSDGVRLEFGMKFTTKFLVRSVVDYYATEKKNLHFKKMIAKA